MLHLFAALCDLAELALGCETCKTRDTSQSQLEPLLDGRIGGLVQLWGKSEAREVGVLAAPQDCRALAERLLGKPASGAFPDSIVHGAMCELAYLLAGGVKRRMTRNGEGSISVGQPSLLVGAVGPKDGWRVQTTEVELDAISATLVCVVREDAAYALSAQR